MNKLLSFFKKIIPKKIFKSLAPAYHFCLACLAAILNGRPSEKLIVIGITGTTGKTTTAYLIAKILRENGYKVGMTSTVFFSDGDKDWLNDKRMTMVGGFFTQKMLAKMVKNNCQFAIVETTSEGIKQFRHRFINYDWLIFTGLYPEHVEAHGGFENYKKAKGELFRHLKRGRTKYVNEKWAVGQASGIKKLNLNRVKKTIIANLDDEHSPYFLSFWAEEKHVYSLKEKINLIEEGLPEYLLVEKYFDILSDISGVGFSAFGRRFHSPLIGEFHAVNAMAALCLSRLASKDMDKAAAALEKAPGIPGRFEKIEAGQNFGIIVDYAFEPRAMEKFYKVINSLEKNRVIHVLGSAGGGRDVARRPKLGKMAGENADIVIVTNEDAYDEDPDLIIAQVAAGAENAGKKLNENLFKIKDRREAIRQALILAEEGDLILITGKGSEQLMIFANGQSVPWDDREVVREEIGKLVKLGT